MYNSYKLLWKHLLPDVYTTEYKCAFNSILFNTKEGIVVGNIESKVATWKDVTIMQRW